MGAVRVVGADVLDERHPLQHVAALVPLVGAAVDDGEGQGRAMAEEEDGGHGEEAVHGAGRLGEPGAGVGGAFQVDREEEQGLVAAFVEAGETRQARLPVGDFLPGDLEDDLDGAPRIEQGAPLRAQPVRRVEARQECGDAPRLGGALAAIAQRLEQHRRAFPQRLPGGEPGQRAFQGFTHPFAAPIGLYSWTGKVT